MPNHVDDLRRRDFAAGNGREVNEFLVFFNGATSERLGPAVLLRQPIAERKLSVRIVNREL